MNISKHITFNNYKKYLRICFILSLCLGTCIGYILGILISNDWILTILIGIFLLLGIIIANHTPTQTEENQEQIEIIQQIFRHIFYSIVCIGIAAGFTITVFFS